MFGSKDEVDDGAAARDEPARTDPSGASADSGGRGGTKAERSESTRAALVAAGRELFAERGYAAVGTEEVVHHAGVTRGALYYHFRDKRDLFRAVAEQAEQEIVGATASRIQGITDPWELFETGIRSFLEACSDPALMRIAVLDAPAVLGWEEWREIGARYGLGLIEFGLNNAMDAGALRRGPVRPLAHLLFGSMSEAAMLVANAEDPAAARAEIEPTLLALLEGLRA